MYLRDPDSEHGLANDPEPIPRDAAQPSSFPPIVPAPCLVSPATHAKAGHISSQPTFLQLTTSKRVGMGFLPASGAKMSPGWGDWGLPAYTPNKHWPTCGIRPEKRPSDDPRRLESWRAT